MQRADKFMAFAVLMCFVSAYYTFSYYVSSNPSRPSAGSLNLALGAVGMQLVTWAWARLLLPEAPLWIISSQASRVCAVMLALAALGMQWSGYSSFDTRAFALAMKDSSALDAFNYLAYLGTFTLSLFSFAIGSRFIIIEDRL